MIDCDLTSGSIIYKMVSLKCVGSLIQLKTSICIYDKCDIFLFDILVWLNNYIAKDNFISSVTFSVQSKLLIKYIWILNAENKFCLIELNLNKNFF